MEQARISPLQGTLLIVNIVLPTAVLFLPAIAGGQAKSDAWISVLVTHLAGMALAWVYVTLASRFPGQSLIQFLPRIMGRWGGAAIGLYYLWWWVHLDAVLLREFAEFMMIVVMPETPISVFVILMSATAAYAVRSGAEVIARTNEVIIAIMLLSFVLLLALVAKEMHVEYIRPVLAKGWPPVLRGAWAPISWYGETVTATMLILPFLPSSARPLRVLWSGLFLLTAVLLPVVLMNQLVLDSHLVATSKLPTLTTFQMISVAGFVERVEPVVVAVWILGNLIKISVFRYAFATGLAQLAGLREYRALVLPSTALAAAMSLLLFANTSVLDTFLANTWPPYALTLEFLLPMVLLLVTLLRGVSGSSPARPASVTTDSPEN